MFNFTDEAWKDYVSWQQEDQKVLKRINRLIEDIKRAPFEGIGKPEPLTYHHTIIQVLGLEELQKNIG